VPGVTVQTPLPGPEGAADTMEDSVRERRSAAGTPHSHLFVALEGARPLAGGARFSLPGIDEVDIVRGDQRAAHIDAGARRLTLQLPSPSLSRLHARLRRAPMGWHLEDAGSRNGCYVNGQRVERCLVRADDVVEVGHTFLIVRDFDQRPDQPSRDLDSAELEREPSGLRTLLPSVAAALADLRRVARSPIGILLVGESGTGKEVLARSIHELSERPGPFVAVNCNTLTEGLVESQLFGHVKGAFSGAIADAAGFVRAADRGTLLLDEVGDLGSTAQGRHPVDEAGQAREQIRTEAVAVGADVQ
jgi:hypothetical protein